MYAQMSILPKWRFPQLRVLCAPEKESPQKQIYGNLMLYQSDH